MNLIISYLFVFLIFYNVSTNADTGCNVRFDVGPEGYTMAMKDFCKCAGFETEIPKPKEGLKQDLLEMGISISPTGSLLLGEANKICINAGFTNDTHFDVPIILNSKVNETNLAATVSNLNSDGSASHDIQESLTRSTNDSLSDPPVLLKNNNFTTNSTETVSNSVSNGSTLLNVREPQTSSTNDSLSDPPVMLKNNNYTTNATETVSNPVLHGSTLLNVQEPPTSSKEQESDATTGVSTEKDIVEPKSDVIGTTLADTVRQNAPEGSVTAQQPVPAATGQIVTCPGKRTSVGSILLILIGSLLAGCLIAWATKVAYGRYKSREYVLPTEQREMATRNGDS